MKKFLKNIGKKFAMLGIIALFLTSISPAFFAIHDVYFTSENSGIISQAFADGCEGPNPPAGCNKKSAQDNMDEALLATEDMKQKIAGFAALFVSIFTPIIALLAKFIGSLMGDEFIMGSNSTGGATISALLYELWLVFRDIMNYLFILILLFIAFMNIIAPATNGKAESYALKNTLPKLILAIVVINMTWFGARVVFDAVEITTRIVFSLPQSMLEYKKELHPECKVDIKKKTVTGLCDPIMVDLNLKEALDKRTKEAKDRQKNRGEKTDEQVDTENKNYFDTINDSISISEESIDQKGNERLKTEVLKNIQNDIEAAKKAKTPNQQLLSNLAKKKEMMDNADFKAKVNYNGTIIYWADFNYERFNEGTIAPLFAFSMLQIQNLPMIATEGMLEDEGGGWSTLLINTVMALVLMIIIMALFFMMMINLFFRVIVLWVNIIFSPFLGLMMFSEELGGLSASGAESYIGITPFLKHAFAPAIMGLPMVIGFIMIIVAREKGIAVSTDTVFSTPLVNNLSNVHQIFFYGLTIAIMWMGGVKAIEATSNDVVQKLIDPVKNGIEGAAQFIAKAPMYLTFIPVASPNGEDTRLNLQNLLSDIPNTLEQKRNKDSSDNFSKVMQPTADQKFIQDFENTYAFSGQSGNSDKFKEFNTKLVEKAQTGGKALSTFLADANNDGNKYKPVIDTIRSDNGSIDTYINAMARREDKNLSQAEINKMVKNINTAGGWSAKKGSNKDDAKETPETKQSTQLTKAREEISKGESANPETVKDLTTAAIKAEAELGEGGKSAAEVKSDLSAIATSDAIKQAIKDAPE